MTTDLSIVSEAATELEAAKAKLQAAILTASRDGHSNRAIGKAAGVSYEAVRLLVRKAAPDETAMRARLTAIDSKWDALVGKLSGLFEPANLQGEQARRNLHNGKARKIRAGVDRNGKARGSVSAAGAGRLLPTVRAEARGIAEATVLQLLEDRIGEPWVDRVLRDLDEAETLRETLTALDDSKVAWLHG